MIQINFINEGFKKVKSHTVVLFQDEKRQLCYQ